MKFSLSLCFSFIGLDSVITCTQYKLLVRADNKKHYNAVI